jgi:nucleoid DNA-binding protein
VQTDHQRPALAQRRGQIGEDRALMLGCQVGERHLAAQDEIELAVRRTGADIVTAQRHEATALGPEDVGALPADEGPLAPPLWKLFQAGGLEGRLAGAPEHRPFDVGGQDLQAQGGFSTRRLGRGRRRDESRASAPATTPWYAGRAGTLAPQRTLGEARVNKSQLVEQVAKDTGLSRTDARRAVDSVIATVQKALKKGEDVSLTGFGRFSVVKRAARKGVNPQPVRRSASAQARRRSSRPVPASRRPWPAADASSALRTFT